MRRKLLIVIINITIIFSTILNVRGEFGVEVGEEFQYEVKKSNWKVIREENDSSGQGFSIAGHHFNEGNEALVRLIGKKSGLTLSANWTIKKDSHSELFETSDFQKYLGNFLYDPEKLFYNVIYSRNETARQEGPNLDYFF
jgi:hypothetical protein